MVFYETTLVSLVYCIGEKITNLILDIQDFEMCIIDIICVLSYNTITRMEYMEIQYEF